MTDSSWENVVYTGNILCELSVFLVYDNYHVDEIESVLWLT